MKIGQYMRQFSVALALLFLQTIVISIFSLFLVEEWKEEKFPNEMKVAGITIGGLTYGEAQQRLEGVINKIDHLSLQVTIGDRAFLIDKEAIKLTYDIEATLEQAQDISREQTMIGMWQKWQGTAPSLNISFHVTYDEKALEAIVVRIRRNVEQEEVKLEAESGTAHFSIQRNVQVDVSQTIKAIDEELRMFNQHLRIPLVFVNELPRTNRAAARNVLFLPGSM